MNQGVAPARDAIESGDEEAAIGAMTEAIGGSGKFDSLPEPVRQKCRRNIFELKACVSSDDRYADITRPPRTNDE